jgi:uncharacterized Zn-binding protein involved in type VI secretion
MPPAARKGDLTTHGGVLVEGSPDVTIGGMAAARLMDKHVCPLHGPGPVTQTSFTVYINKVGAARVGDACTCMIPSSSLPGASNGKADQGSWKFKNDGSATKESKYATEGEGSGKNLKEAFGKATDQAADKAIDQVVNGRDPKDQQWKPKVAVGTSKELFSATTVPKGADGKPVDNYAQFFSGSTKGTASANAEFSSVKDMKANAGAKAEVEGSLFAAAGKAEGRTAGGALKGDVSGEAKVLTAKADAGAQGNFEVKNGKIDAAYVEAGAGAGASVVEGKVAGNGSVKIPFINWRIGVGGEASGALLTAEARASAYAGYKDGKFQMGFGAKVGALLAGLGFKFNITIEKDDPPADPPKPPGVPGVAGIDPIAIGCMTVLIGGMPPPYIPGAPAPDQPPSVIVDKIGIRNKSQALTLKAAKRAAAAFTPIKCDW